MKKVVAIQNVLYLELNCFALAILLVIYFNIRHYINKYMLDQRIFLLLVYTNAIILIMDALMWMFDGVPGTPSHIVYSMVTTVYYILNPFFCAMWYLYADFFVYRSYARINRRMAPVMIPALVNLLLSVGSNLTGVLFDIDVYNVYHRGPYFLVMAGISFGYLIYAALFTLAQRKKLPAREYHMLLLLPLLPLFGAILQVLFYGLSLIWICSTLSALIIFIRHQNSELNTDHLTGLYNRRQLDSYLQTKSQSPGEKVVAGIMIDLNDFKLINDAYGHDEGDRALAHVADILKGTFRESDFVARYGGDEFVVILEVSEKTGLSYALTRLDANVEHFNAKKNVPYTISLSIGCDFYPTDGTEPSEFLKHIDALMYEEKKKHHPFEDGIPKQ
ncbi:MAG TPA: GGDEF domain-containing protein [Clostridia bacterium]|nr:GGDEF domain-containing protein [Clostridia bacterium]